MITGHSARLKKTIRRSKHPRTFVGREMREIRGDVRGSVPSLEGRKGQMDAGKGNKRRNDQMVEFLNLWLYGKANYITRQPGPNASAAETQNCLLIG